MARHEKIIVVGAGWYGCHIAIELAKLEYNVTLMEREHCILSRCSGTFGIRLHRGPHYPRSPATRQECQKMFTRFLEEYPELVCWHETSIYAYGLHDAKGHPSKISLNTFENVCFETPNARRLSAREAAKYHGIAAAFELREPSIVVGEKLRTHMTDRLARAGVKVILMAEILDVQRTKERTTVTWKSRHCKSMLVESAGFTINATGYQAFCEHESIRQMLGFTVVYQACIAFQYKDNIPGRLPISFIVMDGWYPCLMPDIGHDSTSGEEETFDRYILTHGCYTILGSYQTSSQAQQVLDSLDELPKLPILRNLAENEMCRFWPEFGERFTYKGWTGEVLAKPRTDADFRSSLTFATGRVVHVVPGKISNVFNASDETLQLIGNGEGKQQTSVTVIGDDVRVVSTSPLLTSKSELQASSESDDGRTTHNLQTLRAML